MTKDDADLFLAADAAVQAILACEVSDKNQVSINKAFGSIACLRLCFTEISSADVIVSSNLLQRGEVLFRPVKAASSCSRQAAAECRPAFLKGADATQYSDLAVAVSQDAATAHFCVPLPTDNAEREEAQSSSSTADEPPCIGSLIIGFHSEADVHESDLRTALLLARHIAVNHHATLGPLLAGIKSVLSPNEKHPGWGDAGGLLRLRPLTLPAPSSEQTPPLASSGTETDDDASFSEGQRDSSGAFILSPVQQQLLESTNPVTLSFPSKTLERQYLIWRGARMARVDVGALATLLAYHLTRCAALSTPASSARAAASRLAKFNCPIVDSLVMSVTACEWMPVFVLCLPLALAVLPMTHRWYSRRRDVIVACLYVILSAHHAVTGLRLKGAPKDFALFENPSSSATSPFGHGDGSLDGIPAVGLLGNFFKMVSSMDGIWVAVLSIIINVQHPFQIVLLVAAVTTTALVAPPTCPVGFALLVSCWTVAWLRVIGVQMLLPATILYVLEYGTRTAFCTTPWASRWAWRREMQRPPRVRPHSR